jgi:hypothetical protein
MAAEIGEGRRCRQSKIDFLPSALAMLLFLIPPWLTALFSKDWGFRNHGDNRRALR